MGTIKVKDRAAETAKNLEKDVRAETYDVKVCNGETYAENPAVQYEDETKTDENSRLYYLNNGTAKSVISAVPTNFYDEEEKKWKRIDNTLEERDNAYVTKAGAYKTEITKADVNRSVKISKKDKEISWTYLGRQSGISAFALTASAEPIAANTVLQVEKDEGNAVRRTVSRAVYENAEMQTDIEYRVHGNGLKENIIVKEKSDEYRYMFALNTKGLKMRLSEDNAQIELYSDEKTEFAIPAPYMYDANGVKSDEVYYELEPCENSGYAFAVVASSEWINSDERAMPVTIDPQIVTSELNLITKTVEYRNKYSTSSSGYTYSPWYASGEQDVRVLKNSWQEIRTKLTINKSALNILKNRVIKAKLILKPTKTFSGYMRVDGQYKYYSGGNITIDLASFLSGSASTRTILIEPSTYTYEYIDGGFSMTANPPELEVEYLTNEELKPCEREVPLCENVTGILDVPTGEFMTEIASVSGEGLSLPCGISHIFKRGEEDYGCGKNIRLNLHEKLEKADTGALNANYVYTDKYGNKHGLTEHFYRVDDNNNKISVTDKTSITVNVDGRMQDTAGNEVYKEELSDTGLRVITKLEGVKNIDYFEQRQDEIKQLEEQVTNYENSLKEYVVINKSTGDIVLHENKEVLLENLSEDNYKTFMDKAKVSNYMPLIRSEALQYKNLKNQFGSLTEVCENTSEIVPKEVNIKQQLISKESEYYELNDNIIKYIPNSYTIHIGGIKSVMYFGLYNAAIAMKQINISPTMRECIENKLPIPEEDIRRAFNDETMYTAYKVIDDETSATLPKMCGYMLKSQLRQRNLFLEQIAQQQKEIDKQIVIVQKQIDLLEKKKTLYMPQIAQYYKEYVNKAAELKLRKKYSPENYISDGEIIKGFNEDGDLVALCDNYENTVVIERDRSDRISRIYDNNENAITFYYNTKGKLKTITDVRGRVTEFGYSGDNLQSVKYHNGKTVTIACGDKNITAAECSEQAKAHITYKGTRLESVTYSSLVKEISHGKATEETIQTASVSVAYGKNQTAIRTSGDMPKTETYRFDANGNLSEYYAEEDGKVTQAEIYSFKKREKDNTEYAQKDTLNKDPLSTFKFVKGEYKNAVLDKFNNVTLQTSGGEKTDINTTVSASTAYAYDNNHRVIAERTTVTTQYPSEIKTTCAVKTYAYNSQGNVVRTESYVEGEELTAGKTIEETVYNEKGHVVKSFMYNSLDTSSKFYTESECSEDGKVTAEIDETGENKTKLEYVDGTCIVRTRTLPNGSKFGYGHDENDNVTAITQSTEEGEENSTQTAYTCGEVTELRSGNNSVRYEYDYKRRKTAVDLNNTKDYVKFAYADKTTEDGQTVNKVTATYTEREKGVQDEFQTLTDMRGKAVKTKYNGKTQVSYAYDEKNRLSTVNDIVSGEFKFGYDELDRIINYTGGGVTETYAYNTDGNVATKTVTVGDSVKQHVYSYKDNAAKDLESVTADGVKVKPQTDILGRNSGKEIAISGKTVASEHIYYRKHGDHATNMPSTIRFGNTLPTNNNVIASGGSPVIASGEAARQSPTSELVILDTIKYSYDSCGNISEIYENGKLAAKYTYDKLNRIVREDNKQRNRTLVYTYDNNGNILSKRDFSFTLKDTALLEELTGAETLYAYSGDRLMAFGNELCEYDGMGNPKVYRNKECLWEKGRQLVKYDGVTFAYNGQGKRISKTVNGITTNYTYDSNGNLIKQSDGTNTLEFIYDNSGVVGVKHNGSATYIYRKNVQGDIIAILDSTGKVVVKYVYEAWGNHDVHLLEQVYASEQSAHIGSLNPFRYRSYYYDTEIKLYYLKTRYYDAQVGRFITIDDLSYIDPEHINGLNLYAYCGNNPIMNTDTEGTGFLSWLWDKIKKIFTVVIAVAAVIGGVVLTVAAMAASPLIGFGLATMGGALLGMGGAMLGNISTQIKTVGWDNWDVGQTWVVGGIGAIGGAITGALAFGVGKIAEGIGQFIGFSLGKMSVAGLQVSKVFCTEIMMAIFGKVSSLFGAAMATYAGDYIGSKLFDKAYTNDSTKDTTKNIILDWILQLGRWLYKI